jgi:type IV pilus assembly protein PilA
MRLQVSPRGDCGIPVVAGGSEISEIHLVMKKPSIKLSVQKGFSLVELLVVIAVIAVIAAIAIPNIANITGAANAAKSQRNAQNLASVAAAAQAAGASLGAGDKAATVALLSGNGTTATINGVVMTFKVDSLSADEQTAALAYLAAGNGTLTYVPAGGQ